jgi:hypothetical protein
MLILPPDYPEIDEPLIFLAGPIQGARNWQEEAVAIIHRVDPTLTVASPRRPVVFRGEFKEAMYEEQVDWETHHLRKAGANGVVLFWLAKEDEHDCGRAYAQTTRFELGEWKERNCRKEGALVLGIEPGYTGARYIRRRFAQDCPLVPIFDSLAEACRTAAQTARHPHLRT